MTTLGKNVKITAPESARALARAAFEVFGGKLVTPHAGMDVFAIEGGNIGFEYSPAALTPAQMRVAPWLEFAVDDVATTGERLVAVGLERLEYRDKEHLYFVGPAGVVFRLTSRAFTR